MSKLTSTPCAPRDNGLASALVPRRVTHDRHPFGDRLEKGRVPTCWARSEGKVFLNTEEDIRRAIRYVEENPLKEGRPRQHWRFVQPLV